MLNQIFPKTLKPPHIPLLIPVSEALSILKTLSKKIEEETEKEHSFTVKTDTFDMAIYEEQGQVKSVWYNDPIGRGWPGGITRKVNLYLARYGSLQDWEIRMNNGWMKYYFNEVNQAAMVYGIHKDVIRFNCWVPEKN